MDIKDLNYFVCYNEVLKYDNNLSNIVLEEFYSNLLNFDSSEQIADEIKQYDIEVDFTSWRSSLKTNVFNIKNFSKCEKNINCLSYTISKQDVENLFDYPKKSTFKPQNQFRNKQFSCYHNMIEDKLFSGNKTIESRNALVHKATVNTRKVFQKEQILDSNTDALLANITADPKITEQKNIPDETNEWDTNFTFNQIPNGHQKASAENTEISYDNFDGKMMKNEVSNIFQTTCEYGEFPVKKFPHYGEKDFGETSHIIKKNENFDHMQRYRKFIYQNPARQINKTSEIDFKTAKEELIIQNSKKNEGTKADTYLKKSLGARRFRTDFVPPFKRESDLNNIPDVNNIQNAESPREKKLASIEPKMIELINNEIINNLEEEITWNDIAGLDNAKSVIQEIIIWPILRPDIFTGIRRPPKGILFFGPPGTGKTLIGKCIASQSKSKFFSISASSLTSKWIGEGEKMVRALFAVASVNQPSVIFIDEIDSLLSQRSESEHESSRRLKTEFLIQLDGATTSKDDQVLIIGATNRPQELDDAARRRFVRRLYIPLPDEKARKKILENLCQNVKNCLCSADFDNIAKLTENYSGADMASLSQEACMEPLRSIPLNEMLYLDKNNVRAVTVEDFMESLKKIRPSVSINDLNQYLEFDKLYGSGGI